MSYDFQAALAAAQQVVERSENAGNSGGSGYTYPLLYPPAGNSVTLRILFNPASGQIVRLINRHEKTACYRTYGQECPICQVMQQVKDVTGQDPFGRTKSSKSRGIAIAQYVASTLPIDKGGNRGNLQPGETVLFMFPWSVYSQINTIIQTIGQAGAQAMDQAFCHANTGLFINVSVTSDFKYTTVQNPYMQFQSAANDDEFMKMLDGLESLNDLVLPSTITEDLDKQVKEYADAVYRQYLAPRLPSQGVPAGTAPVSAGTIPGGYVPPVPQASGVGVPQMTTPNQVPQAATTPSTGYVAPTIPTAGIPSTGGAPAVPAAAMPQAPATVSTPPPATQPSGNPACFGQHVPNAPQCICCPCEVICMQSKGGQ